MRACTARRSSTDSGWLPALLRDPKAADGWTRRACRPSFMRGKTQVHAGVTLVPPARDDLRARVKSKAVLTVDVQIAEERRFPAAETVVADGHRNRYVDAHHAGVDFALKAPRRGAAAREDRRAVAVRIVANDRQRLVQRSRAQIDEHGAENLVAIDRHRRPYAIEQRRADEKSAFVPLDAHVPPVGGQFGAFALPFIYIVQDALACRRRDHRTHVVACIVPRTDFDPADAFDEARNERFRRIAHGNARRNRHAALAGG